MYTKSIEKNWAEIKGKIQAKWSKFTDQDLESFKGDLSLLSGKIQKAYGLAKDQADRQFEEFKKSVAALIEEPVSAQSNTPLTKPTPVLSPVAAAEKSSVPLSAQVGAAVIEKDAKAAS